MGENQSDVCKKKVSNTELASDLGSDTLDKMGGKKSLPRGLKNNNPGNLKISDNKWRGKIPVAENTDGVFEQFESLELGARAMLKNLQTYFTRDRLHTVEAIVTKWSPPSENPTLAYIAAVAKALKVRPQSPLVWTENTAVALGKRLSEFENGKHELITAELFRNAFKLI